MTIQEIRSFYLSPDDWRPVIQQRDRLGRSLFAAAANNLKLPNIDILMSCDKEKVDAAKGKTSGTACYVLYELGSSPESGYVEVKNSTNLVLSAVWYDSEVFETVVKWPPKLLLSLVERDELLQMQFRIAGKEYDGKSALCLLSSSQQPSLFHTSTQG